jgi:DNA-directed RNA polymerase specialized sigma24 family protein
VAAAAWLAYVQEHTRLRCPSRFRDDVTGDAIVALCIAALSERGVRSPAAYAATFVRHRLPKLRRHEAREICPGPSFFSLQVEEQPADRIAAQVAADVSRAVKGPLERWIVDEIRAGKTYAELAAASGRSIGKLQAIGRRLMAKLKVLRGQARRPE